jgi:hypothetical protein
VAELQVSTAFEEGTGVHVEAEAEGPLGNIQLVSTSGHRCDQPPRDLGKWEWNGHMGPLGSTPVSLGSILIL